MKISKRSWHYKFLRMMDCYPNDNLCPYMRQLFTHMLAVPLALGILFIVAGTILYPLWQFWFYGNNSVVLGFVSAVFNIILTGALLHNYRHYRTCYPTKLWGAAWLHFDLLGWIPQREYKPRKPSVFVQYASALHDKVCPGLEFTED